MNLDRGSVVLVGLDPTVGHEQRGLRPCIAVSDKRRIHRLFGRVAADELAALPPPEPDLIPSPADEA